MNFEEVVRLCQTQPLLIAEKENRLTGRPILWPDAIVWAMVHADKVACALIGRQALVAHMIHGNKENASAVLHLCERLGEADLAYGVRVVAWVVEEDIHGIFPVFSMPGDQVPLPLKRRFCAPRPPKNPGKDRVFTAVYLEDDSVRYELISPDPSLA